MINAHDRASAPSQILVVDDHEDSRVVARMVLEHAGYEVSVASTGLEGLAVALTREPDLVLLDIVLPEIDGLEVARRMRAHPALHHVRIVAVTAMPVSSMREEALLAGCDAFLLKPYHISTLRTIVFEQLMYRRQASRFGRSAVRWLREQAAML